MKTGENATAVTPPAQQSGDDVVLTEPTTAELDESGNPSVETPPEPNKTYTLAEVNAAAARARKAAEDKFARDEAVKQGEYQTLFEQERAKAAKLELAVTARDICDELEIPREWRDSVVGESEESLRESATSLKTRLDKLVQEAVTQQKGKNPGTPPPSDQSSLTDAQKEEEGRKKTRELVNAAMGFGGIKLAN